jgi:hypothetical protein
VYSRTWIDLNGRLLLCGARDLLLWGAFVLLRHQTVADLELGYADALGLGLSAGLIYDVVAVMVVGAVGLLAGYVLPRLRWYVWLSAAFVVWLASLANLLYFRFFGGALEWWIVKFYLSDVPAVASGAFALALSWPIWLSGTLFGAAAVAAKLICGPGGRVPRRRRRRFLAQAIALFAASILLRETPSWLGLALEERTHAMLREQVLQSWLRELTSGGDGQTWNWREAAARARQGRGEIGSLTREEQNRILGVLNSYRKYREPQRDRGGTPASPSEGLNPEVTLYRRLEPAGEDVNQLRARLGLAVDRNINVIVLFVEALRALELQHDVLGPLILPNLRRVLLEHGVLFTQAYSSSFSAGQTVRGQFSALCSMLPNITGVATYIGYSTFRVPCLAELFGGRGYETLWFNSHLKTHHNKNMFESLHGTRMFYDFYYFWGRGIRYRVGDWGVADGPFLEETARVLEDFASKNKPFFANVLTISTHFPYSTGPEGEVPPEIFASTYDNPRYRGYLSRLRYADEALGAFFDRLFGSRAGENTVVILLGDHSTGVRPHLELDQRQLEEMRFRVPIAILARDLRDPGQVTYPVHQLDVAPTIARIAGLAGSVPWLGRDILSGEGSVWVYQEEGRLFYRTRSRGCYGCSGEKGAHCWDLAGDQDPLFDTDVVPVREEVEQSSFFRDVVEAAGQLIRHDLL